MMIDSTIIVSSAVHINVPLLLQGADLLAHSCCACAAMPAAWTARLLPACCLKLTAALFAHADHLCVRNGFLGDTYTRSQRVSGGPTATQPFRHARVALLNKFCNELVAPLPRTSCGVLLQLLRNGSYQVMRHEILNQEK